MIADLSILFMIYLRELLLSHGFKVMDSSLNQANGMRNARFSSHWCSLFYFSRRNDFGNHKQPKNFFSLSCYSNYMRILVVLQLSAFSLTVRPFFCEWRQWSEHPRPQGITDLTDFLRFYDHIVDIGVPLSLASPLIWVCKEVQ